MSMNITLSPRLENMVREKVESGMYSSASEVVCEALRLLEDLDNMLQIKLDMLREQIKRGCESGPGRPWEEVFAEMLKKIQEVADKKK